MSIWKKIFGGSSSDTSSQKPQRRAAEAERSPCVGTMNEGIKVVGVGNIFPPHFGNFIDLLAPQSGVLRKDFPPDWKFKGNLVWHESANAECFTDKDILRIAREEWGERIVGDKKYALTIVN